MVVNDRVRAVGYGFRDRDRDSGAMICVLHDVFLPGRRSRLVWLFQGPQRGDERRAPER